MGGVAIPYDEGELIRLRRLKALRLPPAGERRSSHADLNTASTTLAREVERRGPGGEGLSGLKVLRDGKDAFAARVLLARSAERTIDVQYYIWHDDLSGSLLLDELEAAASRGVRVRLIVDDVGTARLDARLACLAASPNIEVRLYNPCVIRWPKALNYVFDFTRLNRRMHAKSFTVDSQATILGGRNVGDEYFAARRKGLFADVDVLAVGAVVPLVSQAFDRYWNGPDVRPIEALVRPVSASRRRLVERAALALTQGERAERYRDAVRSRKLFGEMIDGTLTMTWAPVTLVNHDYAVDGDRGSATGLADLMPRGLGAAETRLDVIAGYFVPTATGTGDLAALAERGVAVRVLTNSYAATDVGLVHAGYTPWRAALLKAGVRLFEMPAPDDKPKTARKFVRPGSIGSRSMREDGRTLHAKTVSMDGRRVYIGSANLDPRSAHLNTEMGLLVESPALAEEIGRWFTCEIIPNSYRLSLSATGKVQWIDERDDDPEPEQVEPGTSLFSRLLIRLLARLPIERFL